MAIDKETVPPSNLGHVTQSIDRPTQFEGTVNPHLARGGETSTPLSVEVMRGNATLVDDLAGEWLRLCQEGPCHSPFYTPSWIGAWLEAFNPSAALVLIVARRDRQLRGVLPLIEDHVGLPGLKLNRLTSPANVHSCRIDLIHGAGDRDEVIAAVWQALETRIKWDLIEYRDVPEGGAFQGMSRIAVRHGFPLMERRTIESPYIPISNDLDTTRMGPAKHLRKSLRNVVKAGTYEYVRNDPVDLNAVDRFLDLEQAGWKAKSGSSIASNESTRRFYTSIMIDSTEGFTPVIHELRLDGDSIAFKVGVEMGNLYVEPKGTYSEAHHSLGLGHLLVYEIALRLIERGFREFDLLGNVEPWKERWTTTTRQHYQYLIFPRTAKGKLMNWGIEQVVPWVKRWRKRMIASRSRTAESHSPIDVRAGDSA